MTFWPPSTAKGFGPGALRKLGAWLRSQLITRGLSAAMAVEPQGCGYLEPLMRDKTTSFAPTCLAIATDAKNPKGRLFKLPLAAPVKELRP
ncbi:MAG: hypothetical protein KAI47_19460 [Deltaproteobacteria bacterium]|nr:hypothetical protein [Deltaproteobacteria bacterium]